jgi:hypothetical protein
MTTRRQTLASLAALMTLPALAAGSPARAAARDLFAAALKDEKGGCSFAVFSPEDGLVTAVDLPSRGHGIAVRRDGTACVIFARRPGRFAVALEPDGGRAPVWFETRPDRHFYGHGAFSGDGRLLLSAENDYDGARGVIGVRDAGDGYRQIGEFPSYGIGPHDVAFLSDRRTLVIANGAMQTHPSTDRAILNRATMRPSLAYIDSVTGDLLEEHVLSQDLHQLSIRHLSVATDDTVVFGCQHQGPLSERPPLVGFHRRGGDVALMMAPDDAQLAMENYIGSVAIDRSGEVAALSSPRGSTVTYWDVSSKRYLGRTQAADVCGLAPARKAQTFLLTCGTGQVEIRDAAGLASAFGASAALGAYQWDNHAAAL